MYYKLFLIYNILVLKHINLDIKQCPSPKPTVTAWTRDPISLNLTLLIQIRVIIKIALKSDCVNSMRTFNNALGILPDTPLPPSNCQLS